MTANTERVFIFFFFFPMNQVNQKLPKHLERWVCKAWCCWTTLGFRRGLWSCNKVGYSSSLSSSLFMAEKWEKMGEKVLNSKTWAQCHDLTASQAVHAGMMILTVTRGPGSGAGMAGGAFQPLSIDSSTRNCRQEDEQFISSWYPCWAPNPGAD